MNITAYLVWAFWWHIYKRGLLRRHRVLSIILAVFCTGKRCDYGRGVTWWRQYQKFSKVSATLVIVRSVCCSVLA